jgi:hypothetical protein
MPILNYTTTISVHRTAGEMQEILSRAGANMIVIEYDDRRIPIAMSFQIKVNDRFLSFRLPSQWRGVYQSLLKNTHEKKYRNEDQARRVAWRIIKDWTEAQIAIIEAGAVEVTEVFLPYLVNPNTNRTMFDDFKTGYLLASGDEIVDAE